jgi:hypothetical protein
MLLSERFRVAGTRNFESLYRDHFQAITEHGIAHFELPSDVAEELAHQVLLAAVRQLERMPDAREWLLAAMTAASQVRKGRS